MLLAFAPPVWADPIRIATFNASLTRKGPGLLLRDIQERHAQVVAVARIIKRVRPDILLLNEIDHDYENLALRAFLAELSRDDAGFEGIDYPHFFAPPQNVGQRSGQDLNGNGKPDEPGDAFGFATFRGQYAMALVSRFPVDDVAIDLSRTLWSDVAPERLPRAADGSPFLSEEAWSVMRVSSKGHWAVPVRISEGRSIWIVAAHPTPPVFDGPEDLNGLRNASEIDLLGAMISGQMPETAALATQPVVVLGDLNADPADGDGVRSAITGLLTHPRLQDPMPTSPGAAQAAKEQGGANAAHRGDPALDTADWRDKGGPGNLRVDYVLPSRELTVMGAGVFWPAPDDPDAPLLRAGKRVASDHHLVWVDLE